MKKNELMVFAGMIIVNVVLCGSAFANPWWSPRNVELTGAGIRRSGDQPFQSHWSDITSHNHFQRMGYCVHTFTRVFPPVDRRICIWSYNKHQEQFHQKLSQDHELSPADIENFVKAYMNNRVHIEWLLREMPPKRRRELMQAVREHLQRKLNEVVQELSSDFSAFDHFDVDRSDDD